MKKFSLVKPAPDLHTDPSVNLSEENQIHVKPDGQSPVSGQIKRRKFLGLGLLGAAGLAMPLGSKAEGKNAIENFINNTILPLEDSSSQTDSFEEKMRLLQSAWEKKDYRTARALTNSIRITQIQEQAEKENLGTPLLGANQFGMVDSLPKSWKAWAKGWNYYKIVDLEEKAGIQRKAEPVEILLSFQADQAVSLAREIRVAEIKDGVLSEVISQVFSEVRRGSERICKLLFLADNNGKEKRSYIVFYSNPDAELPDYESDLKVRGEGYGLDIENQYFIASLSRQNGQLERISLKRDHGLELYSSGQGHGEPAALDWAHDYVTEGGVQKMRIALWDEVPDYEVVRGPICTIIRRWGFPYSPVHPVFSQARINMDIEYRFYAGLPYFHKFGSMTAIKDVKVDALRDDEWVMTGQPFTDMMWMDSDEKIKFGRVAEDSWNNLWGIGFFNKDTKDSFFGIFLEHYGEGLPELGHNGYPQFLYTGHGHIWSRYPLRAKTKIDTLPEGAVLHQKNAYVLIPFTREDGPAKIESLRKELLSPLSAAGSGLQKNNIAKESQGRLARLGEAQDSPISKALLWEALKNVKDPQLQKANMNVVDLGLVYDITVLRGGVVKVLFAMPHRGRPLGTYFTYGSNVNYGKTISKSILGAIYDVPGVKKVFMEQTWYPEWSSNKLTDEGRKKLGI